MVFGELVKTRLNAGKRGLLEFARIAGSLTPRLTPIHGGEQAFISQGAAVRGWSMIAEAIQDFA